MGKLLQMKRNSYNYRPISAQLLIRKMLSFTRYFPMYTEKTQIMSGWEKEQFQQQKMWASTN
jgi:hypothetical protein